MIASNDDVHLDPDDGAACFVVSTGLFATIPGGAPLGAILGLGAGVVVFAATCWKTKSDCEREAWNKYRLNVCTCWVENVAQCDDFGGVPSGVCSGL